MKRLTYLLTISLFIAIFSSCSKDDDDMEKVEETKIYAITLGEETGFKGVIFASKDEKGEYYKVAELDYLIHNIKSDNISVDTSIKDIEVFIDYPEPFFKVKLDTVFKIIPHRINELILSKKGEYATNIKIDITNKYEFPLK